MNQRVYDSIYDKLVRHGYVYIEFSQVADVKDMVAVEERFKNHVAMRGITIKIDNSTLVQFIINDWKPYSANIM